MSSKKKRAAALLLVIAMIFMAIQVPIPVSGQDGGDPDDPVAAVKALLSQIDSLQEMQDKKIVHTNAMNEFNLRKPYYTYTGNGYNGDGTVNVDNSAEHKAKQQLYAEYVENMFELRAQAKEAFEALTPEQQAEVLADEEAAANYAKLTPYDKLDTIFPAPYEPVPGHDYTNGAKPAPQSVPLPITPSTNEYTFETTMSYEISQNFSAGRWKHQAANYSIFTLVDVSGTATEWTPDKLYEYNNCNYELAYCCDVDRLPHRSMHYKRVNLEDSGYYSEAAAQHIRAITNISYPFVSMDEMKELLIEKGFPADKANALTRSDMISAVQAAIWTYANSSSFLEPDYLENVTHYGGTAEMVKLPDARWWLRTPTLHDYRNEMWIWYNSNTFPMENSYWGEQHWTFYDDIQDRVDSLVQFLHDLPGVPAEDDQIVISDVKILRSAPVSANDTYSVDLSILLNHGAVNGDVTITITSSHVENGETVVTSQTVITVTGEDSYSTTITAKHGDTVKIVVEGTQVLPRGTYFYLPEVGVEESQALVGVSEGVTKVYAEDSFTFEEEGEYGLRIFKTVRGSTIPISDITFSAYAVDVTGGEVPTGEATEDDIAQHVKPENLVATATTDSTGYAFMELPLGTYLIVEELNPNKVREVINPFFVTIPQAVSVMGDDGVMTIVYNDVIAKVIENTPIDLPGMVNAYIEVTKEFEDWGKANSFRFRLSPVTAGAPMPSSDIAVATVDDPVASFAGITYDSLCFEDGDPSSDVRVFEYTVTEINDHVPGVTYDTTPHTVTVTVTRSTHIEVINEYGDEIVVTEYTAEVSYDGEDSLIITNTFTPVSAHFEATKEFNDWGKADSFTFVLEAVTEGAPMPAETELTVTEGDPTAVFGELEFSTVGVYEYTITEVDDGVPGVTYDTTAHSVTVNVTADPDTNELSAEVSYDGESELIITNTYTASPCTANPEVTKALEGREWNDDDEFIFDIAAVTEGAPMPAETTAAATKDDPIAVFGTIEFTEPGVYVYTITERMGDIPGVTYDTTPYNVTITVTDVGAQLTAVIDYDGEQALIVTNTYTASPCTANPEVTKALEGREWNDDDEFIFDIAAVTEGAPMPAETTAVATKGAPVAVFGTIEFTEPGVYVYTITERMGDLPGVTYDTTPHTVTITVTDVGGALEAVIDYDGEQALIVTNTYSFGTCVARPEVTKELAGRGWNDDDEFIFDIAAVTEGAPMPAETTAVATKGAPVAVFGTIEFTEPGVYVYTITERMGDIPGVTYDTTPHTVTITVTDVGAQLTAVIDYDGEQALIVTNTYSFGTCVARLEVTKELAGRGWNDDDEFIFDIAAVTEGAPMPAETTAVATKGAPVAVFGTIEFTEPGVYVYTITERMGDIPGVTYDTTPHNVTITVTDVGGALEAEIAYDGERELIVTNTYEEQLPDEVSITIPGVKTITGIKETDLVFSFCLEKVGPDGNELIETVSVTGEGAFTFSPITFTEEGVYTFRVYELAGNTSGWIYDATVYTVTVTVTVNEEGKLCAEVSGLNEGTARFTNTFNTPPPPPPQTGGDPMIAVFAAVAAFAAAGVCVIAARIRRRRED